MSSNQIDVKNYFLSSANTNQLKNIVFTQLSKEYNIQPMIPTMNQKFGQIMNYISDKINIEPRLSFDQNINNLNKVLVDKATQGFRTILTPHSYNNNISPKNVVAEPISLNQSNKVVSEPEMPDVNDLYSRLLNETDYSSSNTSKPVVINPPQITNLNTNNNVQIKNDTSNLLNFTQPYLPLEPIHEEPIDRNDMFQKKLNNLRTNRNATVQEERNLIDLETRESNFITNILGI